MDWNFKMMGNFNTFYFTRSQSKVNKKPIRYLSNIFLFLLIICVGHVWAGTWSKLKTSGPSPEGRSVPIALPIGKDIYVIGGFRDDIKTKVATFYTDIHLFNTQTNTWKELNPVGEKPLGRAFPTAVVDEGQKRILMFGGAQYKYDFTNQVFFDELWAYTPSKNSWVQIHPVNQGPSTRAQAKSWFVNDKMYVFGGAAAKTWGMLNDLWVYDTKTNKWTQLIPQNAVGSPAPRHEIIGGNVATKEGKLVLFGGLDLGKDIVYDDTWEYDLKTNKWTNITPANKDDNMTPPRIFSAGAVIGDYMYVQGGNLSGVGDTRGCGALWPQSVTDELWSFDLSQHIWKKLGACGDGLPRLRRNSAAVVDNKMYIFSGWDFQCYGQGPGQIWNQNVFSYAP